MSQRVERVAGEVRAIVGQIIARQEIKDPRVRGASLITITHVRLSGDLRLACALFTVHGAGDAELERVREGLDHASGYFRHAISRRLRLKATPQLSFEIDRVFEKASRVEELLRQVAVAPPSVAAEPGTDGAGATEIEPETETKTEPAGAHADEEVE